MWAVIFTNFLWSFVNHFELYLVCSGPGLSHLPVTCCNCWYMVGMLHLGRHSWMIRSTFWLFRILSLCRLYYVTWVIQHISTVAWDCLMRIILFDYNFDFIIGPDCSENISCNGMVFIKPCHENPYWYHCTRYVTYSYWFDHILVYLMVVDWMVEKWSVHLVTICSTMSGYIQITSLRGRYRRLKRGVCMPD